MKELSNEHLTGERALYQGNELRIVGTVFEDGESPLKHSRYIDLSDCTFKWHYPVWYSDNIRMKHCTVSEDGKAGFWYSSNIDMKNSIICARKSFRHSSNISMRDVTFTNGDETLWRCANVRLSKVKLHGDYFAKDCDGMEITDMDLKGQYAFDGVRNVTVRNSVINGRDAFWNSENVAIYDSRITGMYFCWNSRNITLVNCSIESLQGMCYVDNLMLKNCTFANTSMAFEYSRINADISGHIDSIKNPLSGCIRAGSIGELILEEDKVDVSKTKILCCDQVAVAVH